ncbi:beta-galactosidase/beta-glucuronidase [Friedmanniella endophytica]|uniref:Beta-galactosidase/beta-glucuronidase n=1 Tax=Microlunatus kandeliicorticis TaxID=1759536 RepID=A0A7W3ITI4_9ACTN|nr:sugar-binding domain-containing protein [Microlunatus kandeliicorticis]MBA8794972.1 beta-galactosidase/beta-glucuronidase [Microlunatus kandeliicorticis]
MAPSTQPRPEHPRPQFVRTDWLNLNGTWQFETDRGDSGLERGLRTRELAGEITVPFCPESELSGVADVDFHEAVWYRRTIEVPADWAGRRVLLHFAAVDHDATVWVNDVEVVRHRGGFTGFEADITDQLDGDHRAVVVVRARDSRHGIQARGKQSREYANHDCDYTRTTGIWQTVWLEAVPQTRLLAGAVRPNVAAGEIVVELPVTGNRSGWTASATLADAQGEIVTGAVRVDLDRTPTVTLAVPEDRRRLWAPGDPHLYDLTLRLHDADGAVVDEVASYTALRSVAVDGQAVTINGERVFQRLVLDQGYWPTGIMTAPSDDELRADIERSLAAGFNGARLHQKVFEERFLYHADRLGYLVWGEFGDWGANVGGDPTRNQHPTAAFVNQWIEAVRRDRNHPAIVGWCPLNETHQVIDDHYTQLDDVTRAMFWATKASDPTRPVLDASGYAHRVLETDVWDSHDYEQDPARFAANQAGLAEGRPFANRSDRGEFSLPYVGQPYFVSEFGGIWWNPDALAKEGTDHRDSWGYGQRVADEEEFYRRFAGLVDALLDDPRMFGYCYTQLTDVFQEENGIYRFDRSLKLDLDRIRAAQQRQAAYERRAAS